MNYSKSIDDLKYLRSQQDVLMKELKRIERQNEKLKERKLFNLFESAVKKKKVRKKPPPLVQLPYH